MPSAQSSERTVTATQSSERTITASMQRTSQSVSQSSVYNETSSRPPAEPSGPPLDPVPPQFRPVASAEDGPLPQVVINLVSTSRSGRSSASNGRSAPQPLGMYDATDNELIAMALADGGEEYEARVAHPDNPHVVVTKHDFDTLRPGHWLNDTIIDVYLRLLKDRNNRQLAEGKQLPKITVFSMSFYWTIQESYNFREAKRWNVFEPMLSKCDKILFPINVDQMHWTLIEVEIVKRGERIQHATMRYFDSMGATNHVSVKRVWQFVQDKIREETNEIIPLSRPMRLGREFPGYPSWRHIQQDNAIDCGVFVCKFAECLTRRWVPIFDFNTRDIPDIRKEIIVDLMRMRVD